MFIRRRKNKTGSIILHIVQKINGRQVHVKTLDHTTDNAELKKLEARAHQEIALLTQQSNLSLSYAQDEQHIEHLKSSIQSI